jgi:hypothetical protein
LFVSAINLFNHSLRMSQLSMSSTSSERIGLPSNKYTSTFNNTEQDTTTNSGANHAFRATCAERYRLAPKIRCDSSDKEQTTYSAQPEYRLSGNPK